MAAMSQAGGGFKSGLSQFLGGLFGDSGAPYDKAMGEWQKYLGQGKDLMNPFYQAGTGAIPQYQEWLQGMKDPSAFINKIMGQYQESPFAKYQQQQSMRAGQNAGSASGLTGSTPMMQQMQQNASNISGQDMNTWLQNVLGVNTQYGAGQGNLMSGGQNAMNTFMQMLSEYGSLMGGGAFGKEQGRQQDRQNMIGGFLNMF